MKPLVLLAALLLGAVSFAQQASPYKAIVLDFRHQGGLATPAPELRNLQDAPPSFEPVSWSYVRTLSGKQYTLADYATSSRKLWLDEGHYVPYYFSAVSGMDLDTRGTVGGFSLKLRVEKDILFAEAGITFIAQNGQIADTSFGFGFGLRFYAPSK